MIIDLFILNPLWIKEHALIYLVNSMSMAVKSCLISYMHGWIACTWHNKLWKWNKNFAVNLLIKLSKQIPLDPRLNLNTDWLLQPISEIMRAGRAGERLRWDVNVVFVVFRMSEGCVTIFRSHTRRSHQGAASPGPGLGALPKKRNSQSLSCQKN